jgi:hypothetical protein
MRIEAAEGAFDLQTRRHHHAVHIDCPCAHAQRGEHARDDGRVDRLQGRHRRHREPLQPPTDGARRRHDLHFAEAVKQRIVLHESEMPQPPAPNDQQPNQQADHRDGAEVAPPRRPGTRRADRGIEAGRSQVLSEQLQPGIRGKRDVGKVQLQIPIDSCLQIGSASSHVRWPFVDARRVGWHHSSTTTEGLFQLQSVDTPPEFLSHQG